MFLSIDNPLKQEDEKEPLVPSIEIHEGGGGGVEGRGSEPDGGAKAGAVGGGHTRGKDL